MSYKTLLVHVDRSAGAEQRMRIAARLASRENAHLIGGAATGVSRFIYASVVPGTGVSYTPHLEAHLQVMRQQALETLPAFESIARAMNVASYETLLLDDEAGAGISLRGHYSDLIVISQTNLEDPDARVLPDFPEFLIMSSGRPVLVIPHSGSFETVGGNVLVAWDAGASATRAVTSAIPLLRRADIVNIAVFNAEKQGDAHGEEPGADIALYLARHGIKVNVVPSGSGIDVGNALLSTAMDLESDLLVMGGYGHSRFREMLMGGATRTVLQSMTIPVLMAH